MFEQVNYVRSRLNLVFARQTAIRRQAIEFGTQLGAEYVPQIMSVPDNSDPTTLRAMFNTVDGCSRILVSQVNLALEVTCAPDWQTDPGKVTEHLLEQAPLLFGALEAVGIEPLFCELETRVDMVYAGDEREMIDRLTGRFVRCSDIPNMRDFQIKTAQVFENRFSSQVLIQNYRRNGTKPDKKDPERRGIQVDGIYSDYFMYYNNNRDAYAFHHADHYCSSCATGECVINGGMAAVARAVGMLMEAR